MSETRIVVEQQCEHGLTRGHFPPITNAQGWQVSGPWCESGRRRVLTAGEYLLVEKVDGEWPKTAQAALSDPPLYELSPSAQRELGMDGEAVKVKPRYILNALADQGET